MEIQFVLNDKQVKAEVGADTILLNVLRDLGCKSVKCGCETTNCGLCTVWINGKASGLTADNQAVQKIFHHRFFRN